MGIRTDLALEAREIFEEGSKVMAEAKAAGTMAGAGVAGVAESKAAGTMAGAGAAGVAGAGGGPGAVGSSGPPPSEIPGVEMDVDQWNEDVKVTRIRILTEEGGGLLGKPPGTYVTVEVQGAINGTQDCKDEAARAVAAELKRLLPKGTAAAGSGPAGALGGGPFCGPGPANVGGSGPAVTGKGPSADGGPAGALVGGPLTALIIGLGNSQVTPDSLGPLAAGQVRVTRHVFQLFADQVEEGTSCVSALWPGVMSATGMETAELIRKAVELVEPDVIIAVDALAARKASRISTTIQISDTGISPGAGTGNMRKELKEETVGRKVLAIGVPTVIDSETLILDSLEGFLTEPKKAADYLEDRRASLLVTSSDIDEVVNSFSEIIANAINITLHPGIYS